MKKIMHYMAGVVLTAMAISSCDETTDQIGGSLTSDEDQLNIASKVFNVQTRTVIADTVFNNSDEHLGSVFTQSSTCYLGMVRDPQTQADIKSEFATQFHLLDIVTIPDDKTLETGLKYYSDFNPMKLGMVRTEGLNKNKMFSYRNLVDNDSLRGTSSYMNNIRVSLNEPYTDKNGVTYNNYGTYIIRQFHEHPEYFKNSYAFSRHVCPGFFFEITDGYGFHAKVSNIGLRLNYTIQGDTSVVNTGVTLAGTREVTQTTLITNDKQAIKKLAEETTHTYIKSPAGLFTEVTLPVKEIKEGHENDSLIAAKISFQRINDESSDSRMFGIPNTLLMVQEDSLKTFFEGNNVPDQATSFYANYNYINSTWNGTNTYNFANIASLITKVWEKYQEGIKNDANWEQKHPNWNKVLLVPITYESGSSTNAQHDMSLTSTRLVGGADNPYEPIKINVAYAKFNK